MELSETNTQVAVNQANKTKPDVDYVDDLSASDLDQAQILLACRAYLSRKNKLKWKGKKLRKEAAPLYNKGYFWHDPSELLYLRDKPDPFNLIDNESIAERVINFTVPLEETRVEYSTNPFSTNPLNPSDEHIRRSQSRAHLWSNETWKDEWYKKRWKGRKVSDEEIKRKKAKRRIDNMPTSIISDPEFKSLTEEEVATAFLGYIRTRKKMSDAKKKLKRKRLAQVEEFRQWKSALRKQAEGMALQMKTTNCTRRDVEPKSIPLTFEPSREVMMVLRKKRSEKAKRGYQKRLDNKSKMLKETTAIVSSKENAKFVSNCSSDENGSDKSIQAILRINDALDDSQFPSIVDVETILEPGRLGRRKAILLRILNECFGLRGKCIPKLMNGEIVLHFASTCTISDLGEFVLSKLRDSNNS